MEPSPFEALFRNAPQGDVVGSGEGLRAWPKMHPRFSRPCQPLEHESLSVMPGLVPGIHVFLVSAV